MATEIILPVLGETMNEGTLVEWFKQEGDAVKRGEPLFAVETDKATLEVEASAEGYLRKIIVPAGTTAPVLTPVGIITATKDEKIGEEGNKETREKERPVEERAVPSFGVPAAMIQTVASPSERLFASPRARKRAQELDADLTQIQGSGPNGRIVERDVLAFVENVPKATPVAMKMAAEMDLELKAVVGTGIGGKITKADVAAAAAPTVSTAAPVAAVETVPSPATAASPIKLGPAEVSATQPMTGLRGIIAERMAYSVHATARVTLMTEVDATAFVEVRTRLRDAVSKEWGFAPGYNDLLAIIVARALREFPYLNVRLNGATIEQLAHINMGMAVDTERGLLVPVIRDADKKGLRQFGEEFRTLVERARVGKSLPDDLSGGTFTITNLGMYGVDAFTPVINLPEAAILGVGRIVEKPVVRNGQIVARPMMVLSLAFDHRLTDGAPAARFLQRISQLVEQPYLLLG
ncbi:MAG: 2-oxo acid dehydrogenase subunit E2 [Anaerolineae bacterium]|nr:2-oxo acid dehydrogenase subunit E2 [Anaerolineae bacterium]